MVERMQSCLALNGTSYFRKKSSADYLPLSSKASAKRRSISVWSTTEETYPLGLLPSVQTDLWLFLQRVWIYPSPGIHTRFHMLEATWRTSHTSEPRSSNSPARRLLHTGCLQCVARLVFVQSVGIDHEHDARRLPATAGWSPSYRCCEWDCPWGSLAD